MDELIVQRKEKLKGLTNSGLNPYGQKYDRTGSINDVREKYEEGLEVSVSGRIMTSRGHGKTVFCDISDWTGKIQIYLREDKIGKEIFSNFKNIDIGDIIGVKGAMFKTRTGELTVMVSDFVCLSKSIRPLPEKWHGLKDIETRYRHRYLDLIVNKDVRDLFIKRSKIISDIRKFFDGLGFIEVETPMMQQIPGGAAARPFITHHTALNVNLYLRIAPELYLKRLLVGGFEKIYEINRNFRNEGISRVHNPEFTMLEVYAAFEDCLYMMELTEKMIVDIAKDISGTLKITTGKGVEIDLQSPWPRVPFYEVIKKYAGVDLREKKRSEYKNVAKELGITIDKDATPVDIIDEIFKEKVEKNLINPVFITDYPVELCPLAKANSKMPECSERFELFINGMEVANAYSELNDPEEQRKRFEKQIADDVSENKTIDEDFVEALEYGMPPAGGLGVGIDRLVMVLLGVDSIREVILFPQLKPEFCTRRG